MCHEIGSQFCHTSNVFLDAVNEFNFENKNEGGENSTGIFSEIFFAGMFGSIAAIAIFVIAAGLFISANRAKIADYFFYQSSGISSDQIAGLEERDKAVIGLVKKVNPAVFSIMISKAIPPAERLFYDDNSSAIPLDFFRLDFGQPEANPDFSKTPAATPIIGQNQNQNTQIQKQEIGGGSGFFISPDGLAITNKHVIDDPDATYAAYTSDGVKRKIKIISKDPVLDIAVIKISGTDFPYLDLGNSDGVKVGQSVIAIGNALGEFRNTVSLGIVSGLSRSIMASDISGKSELLDQVIQTDAAINPGNSGGPLVDLSGKVVGVNVAIAYGSENIGFALPSNEVGSALSSVKNYGKIVRPFLGVGYVEITSEIKSEKKLPVDYGALISGDGADPAVVKNSPAEKAGIKAGDIILEIDGEKLSKERSLASVIRDKKIGDKITIKILRGGSEKIFTVTLGKISN